MMGFSVKVLMRDGRTLKATDLFTVETVEAVYSQLKAEWVLINWNHADVRYFVRTADIQIVEITPVK